MNPNAQEVKRSTGIIKAVALAAATALLLLLWPRLSAPLFVTTGMNVKGVMESFEPHGHCYLWMPSLLWLHAVSDLAIGVAYVAISSTLVYFVFKARREVPFHWMFLSFGVFIVACGATHFMEVWTTFRTPIYWMAGYVKVVTAIASVFAAVVLPVLVPRAMLLLEAAKVSETRREQLEVANGELETLYARSREGEAALQRAHDELEHRVQKRMQDLAHADDELQRSSNRLQAIMDNTTAVIYLKDQEGRYLLLNHQFEKVFNTSREQLIGKTDYDLFPREMADQYRANDLKVLESDRALEMDEEAPQADGLHTYISTKFPLRDASGKIYAMCGISTDITERKRAEMELQAAKEEAERANQAKSEFLSRTSHELRTPMNSILGFGQLLAMDELEPEQKESAQQIVTSGRHLLALIDEVLDIARIESGQMETVLESVDVSQVMNECITLVRPLAARRDIVLPPSQPGRALMDGGCFVVADRQRFKQVLLNLLSNAIKFNREGGEIMFGSENAPQNRLRIWVRDTGSGISPEDAAQLFTPFKRLQSAGAVEGTGLGLSLSKNLIEAMEGRMGLESTPGDGSTFWIELPQAQAAQTVVASEPVPQAAPQAADLQPSGDAHTILYIEDNQSNIELTQRMLSRRPHINLLIATEGRQGLQLAREHHPALILLDLHLPDIMGDVVLDELQKDETTRSIPVVMLSADAMPQQIQMLTRAGAREYLTKPLSVKHFLATIDNYLSAPVG